MTVELKVPEIGESIREVEVAQWLKQEGESVARDEPVVVLETDKASVEVPAPAAGTLHEIRVRAGQRAGLGEVLGTIREGVAVARGEPGGAAAPAPLVMPAAARLLAEHGLAARDVAASGPGGRLLKEDVLRHVAAGKPESKPLAPVTVAAGDRPEEVVPMSAIRRTIARRLVEAQQTAALLTTFNEVDMSEVMALRQEYRESFEQAFGVKLGIVSFFVKAAVDALQKFPQVNAEVRGEAVVFKNYFDIGIAVGGGKGLVVPVLREAHRLSFGEIERRIADFAARAKDGRIAPEELQGGTFTISNGGVYGSLLSTPIVNPPQSGILGLHAIQDRPIGVAGQIVLRPMMYVALTYDHRIVDGREAVGFLKRVKLLVERPARLLLEV